VPTGLPGPGPRLQDLLTDDPLEVTLHDGFDHWVGGAPDPRRVRRRVDGARQRLGDPDGPAGVRAVRLLVPHGRQDPPAPGAARGEDPLLDAMARLSAAGGLALGPDSRYVGSFRAHGLLVPVWDLPGDREADALEEPAADFRARLDEQLATDRPLTADERRARAGLMSRQLTLR
jgi:hypothetical protein